MQSRRALLAAGVAVAAGGCLSAPTTEPYYTIDARTVHRDEGALRPSISVADARLSADSTAAVDVSLENESSRSEFVSPEPVAELPIVAPYSVDNELCVRDAEFVEPVERDDGRRCWMETADAVNPRGTLPAYSIDPNETVTRRLLLASPTDAEGCLSAGTYSFETTYHAQSADEELRWTFEIEIREG